MPIIQQLPVEKFPKSLKYFYTLNSNGTSFGLSLSKADIDFVFLGCELSSKYVCMITPAKWQNTEGRKYEEFRENIVPYMSKVVRFKDRKDIMKMDKYKKVTYYMIDKEKRK